MCDFLSRSLEADDSSIFKMYLCLHFLSNYHLQTFRICSRHQKKNSIDVNFDAYAYFPHIYNFSIAADDRCHLHAQITTMSPSRLFTSFWLALLFSSCPVQLTCKGHKIMCFRSRYRFGKHGECKEKIPIEYTPSRTEAYLC